MNRVGNCAHCDRSWWTYCPKRRSVPDAGGSQARQPCPPPPFRLTAPRSARSPAPPSRGECLLPGPSRVNTATPSPRSAGQSCPCVKNAIRRAMPGPPSTKRTACGAAAASSRLDQREMGAGIDDDIDRFAPLLPEQPRSAPPRRIRVPASRRAASPRPVRPVRPSRAGSPGSHRRSARPDRRHRPAARSRGCRARRWCASRSSPPPVDRGHGPHDGQVQRRPHRGQCDGRGGVARDHDQARPIPLRQSPEQRGHPTCDLVLGLLAVRKARTIGDIDEGALGRAARAGPAIDSPPTPESKNRMGRASLISAP